MAIMGRKKKALGQKWNVINKARKEEFKGKEKEKKISKEEHQERVKRLKEAGIIK